MFNLFKMDIYRLAKSASTWIMCLLTGCFAFYLVGVTSMDLYSMESNPEYELSSIQVTSKDPHVGIIVDTNKEWIKEDVPVDELLGFLLKSGILMLVCGFFLPVYIHAEQKNGYIKNIAGQVPHRGQLAVSKFIAIAAAILLMFASFCLFSVLGALWFLGDRVQLEVTADLMQLLAIQYLLHLAFGTLIMFLSLITRSSVFSMAVGVAMSSGLMSFLYLGINRFAEAMGAEAFNIGDYMLDINIYSVSAGVPSDLMKRAVSVGSLFLITAVIGSMAVMKKRDIQ